MITQTVDERIETTCGALITLCGDYRITNNPITKKILDAIHDEKTLGTHVKNYVSGRNIKNYNFSYVYYNLFSDTITSNLEIFISFLSKISLEVNTLEPRAKAAVMIFLNIISSIVNNNIKPGIYNER